MNHDLQRYLDGELPLDALSPADRIEAEQWAAVLGDAQVLKRVSTPPWLETRVMAALPAQPRQTGVKGAFAWLTSPHSVRVRPISVALAGAAAVLAVFLARPEPQPSAPIGGSGAATPVAAVSGAAPAVVYVQFVFADRAAKTVTVAGDFNSWDVAATPLTDTDGDGMWTGRVALRPGLHKYMFVVDGEEWVTDPQADTYIDDGFGMRNAIVTVAQPNGRAI